MATNPTPQLLSAPGRTRAASPKPTWSTTTTSGLDAAATAVDEAGALGVHAAACNIANDWRLSIIRTFDAVHGFIQPRLITVMILALFAAAAAMLLFA